MKLKKWLTSKSLLTFISILSVLLIFSALCGVSLAILHSLGVVEFPSDGNDGVIAPAVGGESSEIPLHTDAPSEVFGLEGDSAYAMLLTEMPFIDQYYIKVQVSSTSEEYAHADGIYDIWRYGEKYRIHRYGEKDEVEYVMICDGDRVQITDFSSVTITYADPSEGFSFSEVVPIPNFRTLFAEPYEITDFLVVGDTCTLSAQYLVTGFSDTIEFSKSTGLVSYYKRIRDEKTYCSVNVKMTDTSFMFDDYMFMFD